MADSKSKRKEKEKEKETKRPRSNSSSFFFIFNSHFCNRFPIESRLEREKMQQAEQNPPPPPQPQQQLQVLLQSSANLSFSSKDDDEISKSALSAFREKEEEIDRIKAELHLKLQARLGRVEEETKRLSSIREELEAVGGDPMRKEIGQIRKKVDTVNKELKPLGQICQKKEKEYKDALDAFNEKNNEKVQLLSKLMEVSSMVGESERLRMKRLEELSKHVDNNTS